MKPKKFQKMKKKIEKESKKNLFLENVIPKKKIEIEKKNEKEFVIFQFFLFYLNTYK